MRPGSPFLRSHGGLPNRPASGTSPSAGAPPWLPFPRHDYDGDGVAHGYDGLVPSESPFLAGDEHYLVPAHHGALPGDPQAVGLVATALGRRPSDPPAGGGASLAGPATIRLEYAVVADDHDRWTDDENRFAISVDPDGGGDGFVPVGRDRLSSATRPSSSTGVTAVRPSGPIRLPGTSPRIDVRIDLCEADPWGRQVVATAVFPT